MATVPTSSRMETCTLASTNMASLKGTGSTNGRTGTHIKGCSKMVSNMEMGSGENGHQSKVDGQTIMKETIIWTVKMDGAISNGKVEIVSEAGTFKTRDKALER